MPKNNPQVIAQGNRRGLLTASHDSQLHSTPVAISVSVTGERTLYPAEAFRVAQTTSNSNPFAVESKQSKGLESSSEEHIPKLNLKKTRYHIQKRRKFHEKDRRRMGHISSTQRSSGHTKTQTMHKCASVQTDPSIAGPSRLQECVGDPGKPSAECFGISVPRQSEKSLTTTSVLNLRKALLSERLQILTVYVVMVVVIFWIASIISDVNIPSDFLKMATNYVRSFKWNYFEARKAAKSRPEQFLELMAKFFKWI